MWDNHQPVGGKLGFTVKFTKIYMLDNHCSYAMNGIKVKIHQNSVFYSKAEHYKVLE